MTEETTTYTASPVKGEAVVLNAEIYDSLYNMFNSKSEEDHVMARLILNTCDIKKSIYWIWLLARRGGWNLVNKMVYLRTKASREFRDKSRLFHISQKSPKEFAYWLEKEGWMTPEFYKYLEEAILKTIKIQTSNEFYDVTIKIKEKYKHLPENTELITFKTEE
jgi:hypothetical protein